MLGILITEPAPLRLTDLGAHPDRYGFPASHPPMRSFLGVPVRVRSAVYGNLYLTDKVGATSFTAPLTLLSAVTVWPVSSVSEL